MANVLKIKRGSSVPSSSDLSVYELGYRTGTTELYINDNGTYRQVGGASSGGAVDSIANFADNRLLTASDADSINGEANLTFDGGKLHLSSGTAQTDNDGMLKVEQTSTSSGSAATNAGINTKNYHGTSQFLQWEELGVRIGSRILTNSGVGDVVFTAGADSEKMRIKADGNVGIGTDSPGEKLTIKASANANTEVIKIRDSGGTEKFVIGLQASTGNPTISTNDGDLYVDATHDINLDAAGGQIFFTQAGTAVGQIDMAGTDLEIKSLVSNASFTLRGNDNGSEIAAIAIDMANAGTATFNHDIFLNKELSAIRFGASQQGSIYEHASDIIISNSAAGNDTIFENLNSAGSEYVKNLFIDGSTSRIGIGTTSPSKKFVVKGASGDQARFEHNGAVGAVDIYSGTDGGLINVRNDGSTSIINIDARNDRIQLNDSIKLVLGTNNDFEMYHDDTNAVINNTKGDLQIYNNANDKDIVLLSDDGVGGTNTYIQCDGSADTVNIYKQINLTNDAITGISGLYGNSGTLNLYNSTTYFKDTSSNVMATLNSSGLMLKNNTFFMAEDADGDDINILGIHSNNNCYIGPSTNAWAGGAMLYGAASGTNAHVWYEGDAERMRIADTGRVGIGTNSPAELLHVAGTTKISSTGNTTLYIDGAGNGYTSGSIVFQGSDDDASYRGTGVFNHDAASDIEYFSGTLYANDAWAVCRKTSTASHDASVAQGANALLMIEGSGDIGIGIENPTAKLHIKDAVDIAMSSSSDGQLKIEGNGYTGAIALDGSAMRIYQNSSARGLVFGTNETSRYEIDGSGNHSIYGNTSFSSPMSVQYGAIFNEGGHDYDTRIEGDTDANLVRVDAGEDRVGIGTGSPGYKLDVHGVARIYSASGDSDLRIEGGASNTTSFLLRNGAGNNRVDFMVAGANAMTINSNRNVGIGTTSINGKLTVRDDTAGSPCRLTISNGGTAQSGTSSRLSFYEGQSEKSYIERRRDNSGITAFYTPADDNPITWNNPTGEFMRFTNSRVGIGTVSPGYKLHVVGNSYFTDQMRIVGSTDVGLVVESTDGASMIALKDNSTGGDYYNGIQASGNELQLKANNNIRVKIASTGTKFSENFSSTDDILHINPTNGGNRTMTIDGEKIDVTLTDGGAVHNLYLQSNGGDTHIGNHVVMGDGKELKLGGDDGIRMQGGNSNGFIDNYTGNLYFRQKTDQGWIHFMVDNSSGTGENYYDIDGTNQQNKFSKKVLIQSASLGVNVAPNATAGRIDASNDVVAYSTSDKRLKENIKPLDNALDKVMKISGVEFDWKELTEKEKKTIHGNEGHDVGVIAQEIEEVLPEVVTTRDNGYKAVKYEKIVPLLIEAIKEQQVQIDELKTQIGVQNG